MNAELETPIQRVLAKLQEQEAAYGKQYPQLKHWLESELEYEKEYHQQAQKAEESAKAKLHQVPEYRRCAKCGSACFGVEGAVCPKCL